jgi:hypothetical protein
MEAMAMLLPRERWIVGMKMQGHTWEEIAEKLGRSKATCMQVFKLGRDKLQQYCETDGEFPFYRVRLHYPDGFGLADRNTRIDDIHVQDLREAYRLTVMERKSGIVARCTLVMKNKYVRFNWRGGGRGDSEVGRWMDREVRMRTKTKRGAKMKKKGAKHTFNPAGREEMVEKAKALLDERERLVFDCRVANDNWEDIARVIGRTKATAASVFKQAKAKVQLYCESNGALPYFAVRIYERGRVREVRTQNRHEAIAEMERNRDAKCKLVMGERELRIG